jgi:peptide/nickel transport system substrate-binding protein
VRGIATCVGLGATIFAAACGSSAPSVTKTTVTFAEPPGASPNYILPLMSLKYFSVNNGDQFQYMIYRPLYWYTSNGAVTLNQSLSLADPPQYSADGLSATVTLKSYMWSDGTPVTTRDIQFWQNLVTANKASWAAYSPGEYPDNVTSMTVNSPTSITFHLSQAYGSYFFTYNELSQITPLPQHVWDKESATGTVGDYDMTTAGAQAVYKFLDSQSADISSYNTNPLWQVVDGPWKLKSLDTSGNLKLVPNPTYSGPVKAHLSEFDEIPFTKDTAEFNQLKGGTSGRNAIDWGYLPSQDVPQRSQIDSLGYTFTPWADFGITYFPENFTNPVTGPIFKQLYFRQAMQSLVDQQTFIKHAYNGYAYPTYGPVPIKPHTNFVDATELMNPYPYSPSKAVSLLQSNGWTVNVNGVSTCTTPGTGSGQCGAGVPAGAKASFNLEYASGTPALDIEMAQFKTDFAQAGIQINLSTAPFNTVIGNAVPCSPGSACKWDMEFWGGGWSYTPDYYPTGDELWATGAGSNSGGYSDPMMDSLILASEKSNAVSALYKYEDFASTNLPVVWMPTAYYALNEINTHLQGMYPLDPELNLLPEAYSWS